MENKLIVKAAQVEAPVKALGRRLKEARERAEKTQVQAGEKLELSSHSAVGQWERGKTLLDTINLILAAQYCGESLDWLVFGMTGAIEKRIAALPDTLRETCMEQITSALESAERLYRNNPKLFGKDHVRDEDPRLTVWSAKDKIVKATRKRRNGNA